MTVIKEYNEGTGQWETIVVGEPGPQGPQGEEGYGIPAGGSVGQIIGKNSTADYDVRWIDPADIDLASVKYLWGGTDTATDPGAGNMTISVISGENRRMAFSGFDADGYARNFGIVQVGDTVVVTDTSNPAETVFARYLVVKEPVDQGGWLTVDVLRTDTVGSTVEPPIGRELTVTATFSAGGGGGGSDGYTYVTDEPPVGDELAPLSNGQTWYDTSTGNSFVWIDDGTSTQWVQSAPGSSGSGPTVQSGQVTPAAATGNVNYIDIAVTFPEPFVAAPRVVTTIEAGLGLTPFLAIVVGGSVTVAGCTLRLFKSEKTTIASGEGAIPINWVAVIDGKGGGGGWVGEAPVDGQSYVRKDEAWVAEGARGVVAYSESTVDRSFVGGAHTLTDLTMGFEMQPDRLYRVSASVPATKGSTTQGDFESRALIVATPGGDIQSDWGLQSVTSAVDYRVGFSPSVVVAGSSFVGPTVWDVKVATSGNGIVVMGSSAGAINQLVIEDVGPA